MWLGILYSLWSTEEDVTSREQIQFNILYREDGRVRRSRVRHSEEEEEEECELSHLDIFSPRIVSSFSRARDRSNIGRDHHLFTLPFDCIDPIRTKSTAMSIMFASRALIICVNVLINCSGIMNNKSANGRTMFAARDARWSRSRWSRVSSVWRRSMDSTSIHSVR